MNNSIAHLVQAMQAIAPERLAEPWDNVGLLIGDEHQPLTGVMLCIDLTVPVIDEAVAAGASAVVAYHPPIFKDVKRLTPGRPESVAYEAMVAGLAVYSPHTALDVVPGGTNDVLADLIYLTDRRPLKPKSASLADVYKLVTYVPGDSVETVADALFEAGAGHTGGYDRCSFRSTGTGTFRGGEGTNPAVGEPGREERVGETKLEVVVPKSVAGNVVAALRSAHPYEEVAFDLLRVADDPEDEIGLGRIGEFEEPVPRDVLFGRIRRELGVSDLLVAGPLEGEVKRVALCAGSCGELLDDAARLGAEFYLTGELRHHDAVRAARMGVTACCVLHSNSERPTLEVLRYKLSEALPGVSIERAVSDVDPFSLR